MDISHPLLASYVHADFFGKIIFIALLTASCISWFFLLNDLRNIRKMRKQSKTLKNLFEKNLSRPLHLEIGGKHPLAMLFNTLKKGTLAFLSKNTTEEKEFTYLAQSDIETLRLKATTYIKTTSQQLSKHLFLFSTITSLAPFLGLLGTVWGILLTFSELQSGLHLQAQGAVMGGLAMALGTTVFGLLVAIPALIGHNIIRSKVEEICDELENFSEQVLCALELVYKKGEFV